MSYRSYSDYNLNCPTVYLSQAKKPSYDDDFDSEVDDDDDENLLQLKQVNVDNKNISTNPNKHNKGKSRKDASEDDSEEDSDFEDPDELEVPGGGKDLDTIRKITGNSVVLTPKASPGKLVKRIGYESQSIPVYIYWVCRSESSTAIVSLLYQLIPIVTFII